MADVAQHAIVDDVAQQAKVANVAEQAIVDDVAQQAKVAYMAQTTFTFEKQHC